MISLSSSLKSSSNSLSFPLFLSVWRADSSASSSSVMLGLAFLHEFLIRFLNTSLILCGDLESSIVPDGLKKELVLDLKGTFDPIDIGVTEEVLGASKVEVPSVGIDALSMADTDEGG